MIATETKIEATSKESGFKQYVGCQSTNTYVHGHRRAR